MNSNFILDLAWNSKLLMLEQKQRHFWNRHQILMNVIQNFFQILVENFFYWRSNVKKCEFLKIILL